MHKVNILAAIIVLGAGSVGCSNMQGGSNSAGNIIPLASVVGPSALNEDTAVAETLAKGGGGGKGSTSGGGGSISYSLVTDSNGNGSPDWGEQVTFTVSTSATTQPQVSLNCSQNGTVVYRAMTGYWDGYAWPWTQVMTLSSMAWTSGAASCTAKLYYSNGTRTYDLASQSFNVGA